MLKVLIVDDEILYRTNLKIMTDWEKNGFILCKDAANGLDALEIANIEKPDIVISDMKMPVMDGLQLSAELNTNYPDIALIVLSNYDDFEYVKSTLKNGAVDYVLKHTLDESSLLETLNRARDLINKKRERAQASNRQEPLTPNNQTTLKKNFLIQLLSQVYQHEDEIKNHLELLDIKLETKNVIAVLATMDDYNTVLPGNSFKDSSLMEFAITNITEEILDDYGNGAVCHIKNEKFLILLSFSSIHSTAFIDSSISTLLIRIRSCLSKFVNISVSFCIGDMCKKISDISKSYESAENLLDERFYAGKNCILKNDASKIKTNLFSGLSIDTEKNIVALLKLKDIAGITRILEDVFENIKKNNLSLTSSQIIFNDLIGIVNRACRDNVIDFSEIYTSKEAPHIILANFETLDDVKNWFFNLFEKLLSLSGVNDDDNYSEYVKNAIRFIKGHFTENISLGDVASELDITSTYLSKLFNEELNIRFSEYISNMRLRKARILLGLGKAEIKDVSKLCGFNNYTYFFYIFKKNFGITPKEYVEGLSKSN